MNQDEELENIEEELTREELEKKKAKMAVSGKSVFEIQKIKRRKSGTDGE